MKIRDEITVEEEQAAIRLVVAQMRRFQTVLEDTTGYTALDDVQVPRGSHGAEPLDGFRKSMEQVLCKRGLPAALLDGQVVSRWASRSLGALFPTLRGDAHPAADGGHR